MLKLSFIGDIAEYIEKILSDRVKLRLRYIARGYGKSYYMLCGARFVQKQISFFDNCQTAISHCFQNGLY